MAVLYVLRLKIHRELSLGMNEIIRPNVAVRYRYCHVVQLISHHWVYVRVFFPFLMFFSNN